jgi:hypothetical protein
MVMVRCIIKDEFLSTILQTEQKKNSRIKVTSHNERDEKMNKT